MCSGGIGRRFEGHKLDTKSNKRQYVRLIKISSIHGRETSGLIKANMLGANPNLHGFSY